MTENNLEIKENGQFKNIDLRKINNGESIVVTKKFADTIRTEKPGKFKPENTWMCIRTVLEYKGEDVGTFINGYYGLETGDKGNKYVEAESVADRFDACGEVGDKVRITMKKELGVNAKEKEIAVYDLQFEKVE